MVRLSHIVTVLLLVIAGAACVIIPTPEWGDTPYTEEKLKALQDGIGVLTQHDVRALLGEPRNRFADGRVEVHYWWRYQGIWISGIPSSGNAGGALDSEHSLCLRFDQAGLLSHVKHFDSMQGINEQTNETITSWLFEIAREK